MRKTLAIAAALAFASPAMAFDVGVGTLVGGALNALPTAVQAAKNGMGMQETHEAVTFDREAALEEIVAEIEKLPPEQREAAWAQAKKSLDKVGAYTGNVNSLVRQQDEARAQIGLKDVAGDLVKGVAGQAAVLPLANSGAVQAVVKGASDRAMPKAIVRDKTGAAGAPPQPLLDTAETAASTPVDEAAAAAHIQPAESVTAASAESAPATAHEARKPEYAKAAIGGLIKGVGFLLKGAGEVIYPALLSRGLFGVK
jgi:hypothetical protein